MNLRPSFQQQHVTPSALELTDALANADEAEPAAEMEPQTRLVLREDPGLQRPDARGLRQRDQRFEQPAPDALTLRPRRDVDAVVGHAAVAATIRVRHQRRPTGHLAVELRDEAVFRVPRVPRLP